MKQTIVNLRQKNEILSMINPMKNMAKANKLSIIQEFLNLIFVITTMLTC